MLNQTMEKSPESVVPAVLTVTDSAVVKIKNLMEEDGRHNLKLRIFVEGGGCSGLKYGFTFDEVINDDDSVVEKDGVMLLVDSLSYQYLLGAEVNYLEDLSGERFVIRNPNAQTTCGCGSSFAA